MIKGILNRVYFLLFLGLLFAGCTKPQPSLSFQSPEELYGELFIAVQTTEGVFADSKTFVDCIPEYPIDSILAAFQQLPGKKDPADLRQFVEAHFIIPGNSLIYVSDSTPIITHISRLWDQLRRPADSLTVGTLIPLPHPYIVPGGRFREVYYWDSYFTMLGLQQDGRYALIRDIIDNFSYLIDTLGHIPNGNRTYYISRSQPPFYSLMIDLLAEIEGDSIYLRYKPYLEKEYRFWMEGVEYLNEKNPAARHVIRMPDGSILNRYWDERDTPRSESYREDVQTAERTLEKLPERSLPAIYRDLRSAAESGWDFSSRWIREKDGKYELSDIHTTDIIPVDLNALLHHLEITLQKTCILQGDSQMEDFYREKATLRKKAMNTYCWNDSAGFFGDYNWIEKKPTPALSLAGLYPLFFKLADHEQAGLVAERVWGIFLKPGGVVTTPCTTGQQWDAPNGWAPLQWICIQGLRNYDYDELAKIIKSRWMHTVEQEYYRSYKLLEKYNVVNPGIDGGGGEYPNQDGFGWTNGVYRALAAEE